MGDCQPAITAASLRGSSSNNNTKRPFSFVAFAALFCAFFPRVGRSVVIFSSAASSSFFLSRDKKKSADVRCLPPADQTERERRRGWWQFVKACMRVRRTGTQRVRRERRGRDKVCKIVRLREFQMNCCASLGENA